jgi:Photosynthetic reaction centre cytochrome C subunit
MRKKALLLVTLVATVIFMQAFAIKQHDEHPQNLKVLPKDISEDDLHNIMRNFSKSLGVHCDFCHVSEKVEGQQRPKFDFASDAKPEKNIARDMMHMTESINHEYLAKINGGDHKLEQITCVTCHMGHKTPNISVDSLPGQPMDRH